MKTQSKKLKLFTIGILSLSSIALLFLTFSTHENLTLTIYILVFTTALIMTVHAIQTKKIFYIIAYFAILIVYNPFIKLPISTLSLLILNIVVVLFYIKNILELCFLDKIKETARIAFILDKHLRELEKSISHLTFHETATVVKREYPKGYRMRGSKIAWRNQDLPDFEFYVLSSYYSKWQQKGGLSAKGQNEFSNVEVHLNFNLTHHVKYAVREEGRPFKTSLFARQLKYLLVKKYHYVDMAKIIGI